MRSARMIRLPVQAMLALQLANNETGVIQPVREIAAQIVKAHHGLMVVDAVQARRVA
jgi:cysteine desulfurase